MADPTLEELLAQQAAQSEQSAALAKQIAALTVPEVESAIALLTGADVAGLIAAVEALRDRLGTGLARDNLNNVIMVLTSVPANLGVALTDLRRQAAA